MSGRKRKNKDRNKEKETEQVYKSSEEPAEGERDSMEDVSQRRDIPLSDGAMKAATRMSAGPEVNNHPHTAYHARDYVGRRAQSDE